jgi:hypothetical protein
VVSSSRISSAFLEREGSLRCSLEPIDGLYCGPDESNPRFCIHIITGDVVYAQKSCSYFDLPLKELFIHSLQLTHTHTHKYNNISNINTYGSFVIQSQLSFGRLLFRMKAVLLCKVPSAIHFQGFSSKLFTLSRICIAVLVKGTHLNPWN